jgi:hypothetical protein
LRTQGIVGLPAKTSNRDPTDHAAHDRGKRTQHSRGTLASRQQAITSPAKKDSKESWIAWKHNNSLAKANAKEILSLSPMFLPNAIQSRFGQLATNLSVLMGLLPFWLLPATGHS